jgi:SAM-dependent methyltransferase
VEDGVVRLLERTDEFYEGVYLNQLNYVPRSESALHAWPLWLVQNGYPWAVRHYVPQGSIVVELGCAGGVRYFGQRYHMVGCDVSFASLKQLVGYERRVQADASICIPLPDASVDAVVSSFFWEHIPPEVKPAMLKECRRILRPRGKIVFLYDVETDNPLIRHYKEQNKPLYDKLFIEGDGHLGYERPTDNIATFEAAGFRIIDHQGKEKTIFQSPAAYTKLAEFDGPGRKLFQVAKELGKSPWFYPYTAFMRVVDELVGPLLSDEWARIDMVVAQK